MSNTVIQIKRSAVTSTPPNGSLSAGELAISYSSDKLFSGNSAGTGVDEIGGKFYVDMTQIAYAQANAAYDAANSAGSSETVSAAFGTANLAYAHANAAFDTANTALTTGQAAFGKANTAGTDAVNAFAKANTACTSADTAQTTAVAAFAKANTNASDISGANTFLQSYADTVGTSANAYADATFLPLSGGTLTGDLVIQQNLTVSGVTTYANTQQLLIGDNILTLNADLPEATGPSENAGIEVNRGSSANVYLQWNEGSDNWQFSDGSSFYLIPTNTSVEVAQTDATNAFAKANTAGTDATNAFAKANTAGTDATNAFGVANLAYAQANTALSTGQAAFGKANTAGTDATNAFGQANTALSTGQAAFAAANTNATAISGANTYLQATFSNAANLTSGTLASGRLSGSYTGITGVGTLTAGTWNGSTIGVPYGGTGLTTVATNGILYGQGTSALAVASAGSEGQVLQADASGVPAFGDLDGGTF